MRATIFVWNNLQVLSVIGTLATPIASLTPLNPDKAINAETLYPIRLVCPAKNNSVLEHTAKRKSGAAAKIKAQLNGTEINEVVFLVAENDASTFEVVSNLPERVFDNAKIQIQKMIEICSSQSQLEIYLRTLEVNRALLNGELKAN